MTQPRCFTVDVDGTPVLVRGDARRLTAQDVEALTELVRACKAKFDAEPPEQQRASIERVRRRAGLTD